MCNLAAANVGDVEHTLNGERWKPRPVLDAAEPLFLDRGDQLPITQERGRHVAVIRVQSQDIRRHLLTPWPPLPPSDEVGARESTRRRETGTRSPAAHETRARRVHRGSQA